MALNNQYAKVVLLLTVACVVSLWIYQRKSIFALPPFKNAFDVMKEKLEHVTPAEIDLRFYLKTTDLCKDLNRSNPKTIDEWKKELHSGRLKLIPLFKSNEYVYPWEKDYLSNPPLKNLSDLPDLELSRVWYLSNGDVPILARNVSCKKREPISFRVDLKNRKGFQRPLGGDELRVWIEEDPSSKSGMKYFASGFMKDLGNGSYIATVTPLWTGLIRLRIGVVYSREYLRAALHLQRIGVYRYIYGLFKRGKIEEVTFCQSHPNVPGRSCVCNLTSVNTVPYYCGRPLDKRLSCKDWTSVWPTEYPQLRDLTPAEKNVCDAMSRPAEQTLLKQKVLINVSENEDKDPILTPCSKTDPRKTWEKQSPRGYWSNGNRWTSMICHEPELTSHWIKECLKSTRILIVGDSNALRIFMTLCENVGCTYEKGGSWPNPMTGRNKENNITVFFNPHEHLISLKPQWNSLNLNGGLKKFFEWIPSRGKHIVIIHYYLHISMSHPMGLHSKLLNFRARLQELFKRNNEVMVGIRGPHISTTEWKTNHMSGGDVLAPFMIRVIHDVFKYLKSRVVFLDGWDMSIGIRNEGFHPPNFVPTAMLRTMLSFKCS